MDLKNEISIPFVEWTPENMKQETVTRIEWNYEKTIVDICVKLILHITLISIFETLFFFMYISSLENNGIEWTINTFVNGAVNECKRMNSTQIQKVNSILKNYINSSNIIGIGNNQEIIRIEYNNDILAKAWKYVGVLTGLFVSITVYIKYRHITLHWAYIILESTSMVLLLGLYELIFFNTIIYPYQPISTDEIERNMIQQLQNGCGLFNLKTLSA